jgi:hydrogenase maturation protein HypF
MPGGDVAALEGWRMVVSWLHHYRLPLPDAFCKRIGKEKIQLVIRMIDKKINSPQTSSAGRLFDTFASLTGICDTASRQAEAATLLEHQANESISSAYPIEIEGTTVSFYSLFLHALNDLQQGVSAATMSAKFHHTMALLVCEKVQQLASENNVKQVVISGGCFQNKRLTEEIQKRFSQSAVRLYVPAQIPCNDSGLSAGQLAIAAARTRNSFEFEQKCKSFDY